jgi:hypothetical protein
VYWVDHDSMSETKPILIIDRGDLPSLTALAIQDDPESVILWHPIETDEASGHRRNICEIKTRTLGVRRLLVTPSVSLGLPNMPPLAELYQAMILIQAITIARQLNCCRVIWPRQVGPDFERMGELVNRASLISEITAEGPDGIGPGIELPLVDLTDEHLVDLLEESGSPMDLFWPCESGDSGPCSADRACRGCGRWQAAFEAMGTPWPWAAVALA